MTEVITLTNIFDIAENPVSKDEMEKIFADITLKLTLKEKWNIIIGKSYADRYRFIKQVQANNLSYRKKLFEKAETDIDLQLALWEKCSREPCYFINFFLWTYNPKPLDGVYNLLFILYPFQEEFVQKLVSAIEAGEELWIEKSREMGFSWLMCAIGLRGFLFRKWSGLMGSYKQDYVDKQGDKKSLFEKIRYMIGRLPKWMLPSDLIQNFMQISSDIIGCSISGDSGKNFGTGDRRAWCFLDEFSYWENDRLAFDKTTDTARCRIFGGTPEGTMNVYGKVMTNHKDYSHLIFTKIRLHRPLHPLKTSIRYEAQKKLRTEIGLAKEIDLSYESSVTGAVYQNFTRIASIYQSVSYNPKLPVYTGRDFGRDGLAFIAANYDHTTEWLYVFDSFIRFKWDILDFCGLVNGIPTTDNRFAYSAEDYKIMERTRAYRYTQHFGDPYNIDNKTLVSHDHTIRTKCREKGIEIFVKKSSVPERIGKVQLMLSRISIDKDQTELISSLTQSRYPDDTDKQTTGKVIPVHNEHSHLRTAMEYLVDNLPNQPRGIMYNEGFSPDFSGVLG